MHAGARHHPAQTHKVHVPRAATKFPCARQARGNVRQVPAPRHPSSIRPNYRAQPTPSPARPSSKSRQRLPPESCDRRPASAPASKHAVRHCQPRARFALAFQVQQCQRRPPHPCPGTFHAQALKACGKGNRSMPGVVQTCHPIRSGTQALTNSLLSSREMPVRTGLPAHAGIPAQSLQNPTNGPPRTCKDRNFSLVNCEFFGKELSYT